MSSLYVRVIDKPTGKVTIAPVVNPIPTHSVPPLALTDGGLWVPFRSDPSGNIYVNTEASVPSSPHFDDSLQTITPGVQQTLIDQIVPVSTQRLLQQVVVATRVTGEFWVTLDGEIIGSGRTGPGCTPVMTFDPARPMNAGDEYTVYFLSRLNAPIQTVECYVQASDVPQ